MNRRNGRTDLEIFLVNKKNIERDVTVISTEGKNLVGATGCRGHGCGHRTGDCGSDRRALRYAENRKNLAHKEAVEQAGKEFFPFVLSVYGSFGGKSKRVVDALSGIAVKRFPSKWDYPGSWAQLFKTSIVFQLHRGNSHMWRKGFESLLRINQRPGPPPRVRFARHPPRLGRTI